MGFTTWKEISLSETRAAERYTYEKKEEVFIEK
jgi:hypothetical protein